jgi:hypothetical protein
MEHNADVQGPKCTRGISIEVVKGCSKSSMSLTSSRIVQRLMNSSLVPKQEGGNPRSVPSLAENGGTRAISAEELQNVHGGYILNMRYCGRDRSWMKDWLKVQSRLRQLSKSWDPNNVKPPLKLSEPLGILFVKYLDDMFAHKLKESLATFAKSLENSPDMDLKDHNLQIPAPGEWNVNLCPTDITVVVRAMLRWAHTS